MILYEHPTPAVCGVRSIGRVFRRPRNGSGCPLGVWDYSIRYSRTAPSSHCPSTKTVAEPWRTTHDYKRHGTTTRFAALNVLEGKLIGECMARHRHQEFLEFLRLLDRDLPAHLDLHLIVDNYGTHKSRRSKRG
jgi:hypothetical protein